VGAKIAAADASLGPAVGTISINTPGTLSTGGIRLGDGHSLQFNAPVKFAASVALGSNSSVSCAKGVVLNGSPGAATPATDLFTTGVVTNVSVSNCSATGVKEAGKFLLHSLGGVHVTVSNNMASGMGVIMLTGGTDLKATSNTVRNAAYGIYWTSTNYAVATNNTGEGNDNFIEFFNQTPKDPIRKSDITALQGHYLIADNVCQGGYACFWGSAGHDIVMRHNKASTCGDVCIDVEISIDATMEDNICTDGNGGGCMAVFKFGDNITIANNVIQSTGGAALVHIHNSTGSPTTITNLNILNNQMTCLKVLCPFLYEDGSTSTVIKGNKITDGYTLMDCQGCFMGGSTIEGNELYFDVTATKAISAISAGDYVGGVTVSIADNTVTSDVAQPAGSVCIGAGTFDGNYADVLKITGNKCIGSHPFPVDINTVNNGQNGGFTMTTTLAGNWAGSNKVIHSAIGASRDSYTEQGRYSYDSHTEKWTFDTSKQ